MNYGIPKIVDEAGPLGRPKPIRYPRKTYRAMEYVADLNHSVPIAHVARVFAEIGLKLTQANGGVLPMLDQVRLQRALVRRAKRDAKRSTK